jgi:SPP1 gp7 family putative phage head morphogenesis protein
VPAEFAIDHPSFLESDLEKIVRGLFSSAITALIREVRSQWPSASRQSLASAANGAISGVNLEGQLDDLGKKTEAAWARQLSSLLRSEIPSIITELQTARTAWVRETSIGILRGITGGRGDSLIHDGVLSLVDMAVAAIDVSIESADEAVSAFAIRAVQLAKSAASRARSASYRYGGIANGILQRALGRVFYTWRTRRDGRVRSSHRALEGTQQRWDDPPVISLDGRRGHPGEDFNCRCIALPYP